MQQYEIFQSGYQLQLTFSSTMIIAFKNYALRSQEQTELI
jgi:hypothetical protein